MTTDQFLHTNRAWRWRWPDYGNAWETRSKPRGTKQPYHGPSKRTLMKRAAKAARRSR